MIVELHHDGVLPIVLRCAVQDWQHPPFSGAIADGYIWGRGTLDVKIGAVGLLEAATALLHEGVALQARCSVLVQRRLLLAAAKSNLNTAAAAACTVACHQGPCVICTCRMCMGKRSCPAHTHFCYVKVDLRL
jgi:hypothetical protein